MKVKKLLLVLCTVFAFALCFAFAACAEEPDDGAVSEYTVTFDANGGTLSGDSSVKVESGKTISGAPTASMEGYDFEAWYTAANNGDKITLSTYKVTEDITLYAHYTEQTSSEKIEVTFNANGGAIDGETTLEVDDNGHILQLPNATRTGGYRFDGWYTAATGGDNVNPVTQQITQSTTLYAHWIKTYVVTFDAGEGELTGAASVTVDENGKIETAPTANKEDETFIGWFTEATDGDKVDLSDYTVTADVTLYAHYDNVFIMPIKTLNNHEGTAVGYRIEAETALAEGTQNSENQTHPGEFTEDVAGASGGHSIGYLGVVGNTVTFNFNSATAGKATLSLVASSANVQMDFTSGFAMWGADQQLTGEEMTMTFNNASVSYEAVLVRGATLDEAIANGGFAFNFRWTSVPIGEVDVVAGLNTLVITMADTNVINMDCLDIQTSLVLTSANGGAASGEATLPASSAEATAYQKDVTVSLVIGGYEGGPAIEKAVIGFEDQITAEAIENCGFAVSLVGTLGSNDTNSVYLCNANGNRLASSATSSRYVAIEYAISYNGGMSSFAGNLSPFTYNTQTGRNSWKDINSTTLSISSLEIDGTTYTSFGGNITVNTIIPCLDGWDMTGSYTNGTGDSAITLSYGFYAPANNAAKTGQKPLIIWLHGAGEGGEDPRIAVLGNQVSNLSKPLIQNYFITDNVSGAYVLAPQAPTMWMNSGDNQQGGFDIRDSIYTESLKALIDIFISTHSDIDTNRIYIGGCSNGGWMTVEMISHYGDFFAGAYPIAVPFDKSVQSDEEWANILKVPMWITQAKVDPTVTVGDIEMDYSQWPNIETIFNGYEETNSNQLYIELLKSGATNVHYSLFNTVTLTENQGTAATYNGHWSWIFTLLDLCNKVQATTGTGAGGAFTLADLNENATGTVKLTPDGEAVGLWAWLAAQVKSAA